MSNESLPKTGEVEEAQSVVRLPASSCFWFAGFIQSKS
jgi:hypothetical protein